MNLSSKRAPSIRDGLATGLWGKGRAGLASSRYRRLWRLPGRGLRGAARLAVACGLGGRGCGRLCTVLRRGVAWLKRRRLFEPRAEALQNLARHARHVLDAFSRDPDQYDLVFDHLRVDCAGEERRQGKSSPGASSALKIKQKLIPSRIRTDITAIMRFKRPYGRGSQTEMLWVACVWLRPQAFCLQVQ